MGVTAVLQLVNNSSMPDLDRSSAALWMDVPVSGFLGDPSAPNDHEFEVMARR